MVITGLITLLVSVVFYFFFPDSPTNARFLTKEERAQAIERIRVNQSGVENKRWKKDQCVVSAGFSRYLDAEAPITPLSSQSY